MTPFIDIHPLNLSLSFLLIRSSSRSKTTCCIASHSFFPICRTNISSFTFQSRWKKTCPMKMSNHRSFNPNQQQRPSHLHSFTWKKKHHHRMGHWINANYRNNWQIHQVEDLHRKSNEEALRRRFSGDKWWNVVWIWFDEYFESSTTSGTMSTLFQCSCFTCGWTSFLCLCDAQWRLDQCNKNVKWFFSTNTSG